ncbi:MAG: toll/interleukin-1 receptor domain-containing protein, partial [Planctomycetes bacterium]|nr:toll/interleukin-1 receptor domain-containing protein [Planctomycetota bacterium]
MAKVFISYSHKDEKSLKELVRHLKPYMRQGEIELWSDKEIEPGQRWFDEIEEARDQAYAVIMLVSSHFLESDFINEHELGPLLAAAAEKRVRILWIPIAPSSYDATELKDYQALWKPDKTLAEIRGTAERDRAWVEICKNIIRYANKQLEERVEVSTEAATATEEGLEIWFSDKWPVTDSELFGRDDHLQRLDAAWAEDKVRILSFVAAGGVGKTAIANKWIERMADDNWRGARRVYGWSFYSQGTKEDGQASGDEFINHALEWFGDAEMAKGAKSPWEKGQRLAGLIAERRTLLLLDGLEPLQYPPGPMGGHLKDEGVKALIKTLARKNSGLCVVSTREGIEDLKGFGKHGALHVDLENLNPQAGVQILKAAGVTESTEKDLLEAVAEHEGHALALNLLGRYVVRRLRGDIRKRDRIGRLAHEQVKGGAHAKHVMGSYEKSLKGTAELDILNLMGLFDRPAEIGAIGVLTAKPAIEGLTEKLAAIGQEDWEAALANLRDLRLLAKEDSCDDVLDCHPLVREHFGEKVKAGNAGAWAQAHGRLYEYYKGLPEKLYDKKLPDTLAEMEPLFRAVYHGCQAGRHQETLDDVYWERICREDEAYVNDKLGAFGSDLGAVACFFEELWSRPAKGLTESDKATILSFAGFALRGVGR